MHVCMVWLGNAVDAGSQLCLLQRCRGGSTSETIRPKVLYLLMCVWPCAELPDAVHQLREGAGAAAARLPQCAAVPEGSRGALRLPHREAHSEPGAH